MRLFMSEEKPVEREEVKVNTNVSGDQEYGAAQITKLEGLEAVRKRSGNVHW